MKRRAALSAVAALMLAAPVALAQPAPAGVDPWQRAIGPWAWSFPRDDGAHPNFKTEWWYYTGNLKETKTGRPFGYQLTLFRQGVQYTPAQKNSKWAVRDVYFGHFTISDIANNKFYVAEKVSRGVLDEVRTSTDDMSVWLGDWSICQTGIYGVPFYGLRAESAGMSLQLTPVGGQTVLQGVNGLSQKSSGAGNASYYYSRPRQDTTGKLTLAHKAYDVTGLSWFDHEFSTSSLGADEVGWDWFCVQLDHNEEIMLYNLRDKSGATDPASEGTWIKSDGTSERLVPGSFTIAKTGSWTSPHSGATYPAGWHITIPSHNADLTVTPSMADQELNLTKMGKLAYWEGACAIEGMVAGQSTRGVGYTELTGYAGTLKAGLSQ